MNNENKSFCPLANSDCNEYCVFMDELGQCEFLDTMQDIKKSLGDIASRMD